MKRFSILFALLTSLFVANTASALVFVSENEVIDEGVYDDDTYIVAGSANINSDVKGDLYVFASNVTVNSIIEEDLIIFGGKVDLFGEVLGDVRVLGGQFSVNGEIKDDLVVSAGWVEIRKDAKIGGSAVIASPFLVTHDGEIAESLSGTVGSLYLNGSVAGDVSLSVQESITVSANAKVGGNLEYNSFFESKIPNDVVAGDIAYNQFDEKDRSIWSVILDEFYDYAGTFILLVLFVTFTPKILINGAISVRENFVKALLVGILAILTSIISFLVLISTVGSGGIGVPLGTIVLAFLMVIFYLGKIFFTAWVASFFLKFKKKVKQSSLLLVTALTLLVLTILTALPSIGIYIEIIAFLIGAGGFTLTKINYIKIAKKKKLI
jgi:cytoskeletal protein CcmA (bactofilin family)